MNFDPDGLVECEAFVMTLPKGVLILDEDSNIKVANHAMEAMTGYSVGRLKEMNVKDLIPPGIKNPHEGKLSTIIQNGGGPRAMKTLSSVPLQRADGTVVEVDVERFVYRHADNSRRFTGIVTPVRVG